jgi:hypothetical protein
MGALVDQWYHCQASGPDSVDTMAPQVSQKFLNTLERPLPKNMAAQNPGQAWREDERVAAGGLYGTVGDSRVAITLHGQYLAYGNVRFPSPSLSLSPAHSRSLSL